MNDQECEYRERERERKRDRYARSLSIQRHVRCIILLPYLWLLNYFYIQSEREGDCFK